VGHWTSWPISESGTWSFRLQLEQLIISFMASRLGGPGA
jgi:hypothetical protein